MAPRKKPLPAGAFMVWESDWQGFGLELVVPTDPREFRRGGTLAAQWPKNARARVKSDWKTRPPLFDDFPSPASSKVCSRRVAEFLEGERLADVELLPLALVDQKGKPLSNDYFVVHPAKQVDCIDLAASGAKLSNIRKTAINSVRRLVLDPRRIPSTARLFRPLEFARVLIIERSLAEGLRELRPDGVLFASLNKHWS